MSTIDSPLPQVDRKEELKFGSNVFCMEDSTVRSLQNLNGVLHAHEKES